MSSNLLWFKDAVIYEVHVKTFYDSNGDGIGDFRGLIEKIDYFAELGVTAIWLLPFYPSPMRDDGYDIADYYSVNPAFGTIGLYTSSGVASTPAPTKTKTPASQNGSLRTSAVSEKRSSPSSASVYSPGFTRSRRTMRA